MLISALHENLVSAVARLNELSMEERADEKNGQHRVKLYVLNEKRSWEDKGTGHVECDFTDAVQGNVLTVRSEEDGSVMLECEIQRNVVYNKQQETLIVWTESDARDLALSFQEKKGCDEIWAGICKIQGRNPNFDTISQDGGGSDSFSDEDSGENGAVKFVSEPIFELPPCEIGRLSDLNQALSSCFSAVHRRDAVANTLESEDYIGKLLNLFQQCEDLEDTESLHLLYNIFKSIFYLNKASLFESLLTPDNLVSVIGVLEYDPALEKPKSHREFLEHAVFKQVLPITSDELMAKIHQTYRIQYIHDVIFPAPSIFEENLLSTLSAVIMYNKTEIVHLVQEDPVFLKQMFSLLESKDTPCEKLVELAGFLKEFVTFSTLLNVQTRETFFKTLTANGVLDALENCMCNKPYKVQSLAADVLFSMVDYTAASMREYAMQKNGSFINCLLDVMFSDSDPEMGTASQVVLILKQLLDPESMMAAFATKGESYDFLTFFYKNCMHNLCSPIFNCTSVKTLNKDTYRTANLVNVLLEMLTFCFEHHTYHIRGFMVTKDLLTRVLVFLQSRHAFVALSALRLLRKTLSLHDEFYYVYIVRHRLFDPVVKCFLDIGDTYNLLNSALLEMFDYIRTENIKPLIRHVVEEYWDSLEQIEFVNTFHLFKVKYEQLVGAMGAAVEDSSKKRTAIVAPLHSQNDHYPLVYDDEDDEEKWFNAEEDDNAEQSVSSSSSALVEDSRASPPPPPPTEVEAKHKDRPSSPFKLRKQEEDDNEFPLGVSIKPVVRRMSILINTSSSELHRIGEASPFGDDSTASSSCSNSRRLLVDYGDSDSDDEENSDYKQKNGGGSGEGVAVANQEGAVKSDDVALMRPENSAEFEMFMCKKQRRIDDQPTSPQAEL